MEWSSSDDMAFNALKTESPAELTNWRSFPASMTYGTVSVLERDERVCYG
jgi:hypothetical protein